MIPVTMSELQVVNSLQHARQRRLMFTLMVTAKSFNLRNKDNNNWVNLSTKKIFHAAGIRACCREQNLMLHVLYERRMIEFPVNPMNLNVRVLYIDMEGDAVHSVENIEDCGLSYMQFCGESISKCVRCGHLFKRSGAHDQICQQCREKKLPEARFVCCLECGKIFFVPQSVRTVYRCPECR